MCQLPSLDGTAGKAHFSAKRTVEIFKKWLSTQTSGMSGSNFFEESLLAICNHHVCRKDAFYGT
jgi:hypothetical protein